MLIDWFGRTTRRRAPRPEDGQPHDRTRAAPGRGIQLRNPQTPQRIRRRDEQTAPIIYEMRRDVLEDRDVTEQLHEMFENVIAPHR
jgi:hypothetical protein